MVAGMIYGKDKNSKHLNCKSKNYIKKLIDQMTNAEKKLLLTENFDSLWYKLWGDYVSVQYRFEADKAKKKFNELKNGVFNNSETITLTELINQSTEYDVKCSVKGGGPTGQAGL